MLGLFSRSSGWNAGDDTVQIREIDLKDIEELASEPDGADLGTALTVDADRLYAVSSQIMSVVSDWCLRGDLDSLFMAFGAVSSQIRQSCV
jgi:hypothetical protein